MGKVFSMLIIEHSIDLVATLHVNITNGTATSVVASKSGEVISLTYDSVNGYWKGNVSSVGVWTITATDGTDSGTAIVDVSTIGMYAVDVSLEIYYLSVTTVGGTATSVTASKDSTTLSLTYNASSGTWGAKLPSTGTWSISGTDGTQTVTSSVSVSTIGTYEVTLAFILGTLQITVSNGTATSVTATQGSEVVNLTYVNSVWTATVGQGTWAIKAVKSDYTKSGSITVTATQTYTLTLTFNNLPDGYTEKSYITYRYNNDESCQINTSLFPISTNRIEGKFMFTYRNSTQALSNSGFSAFSRTASSAYIYLRMKSGGLSYCSSTSESAYVFCVSPALNTEYTYNARNNQITLNNTVYTISGGTRVTTLSGGGTCRVDIIKLGSYSAGARYYYFKMWNTSDTSKESDMVPAMRNSDGVYGFYDKVRNSFYTANNISGG